MGNRLAAARIVFVLAAAFCLGCSKKIAPDSTPDPRAWLIQSYDHGTITATNDGKTYKATCDGHRTLGPDQFVYDVTPSFPCSMAVEAVGINIEPITLDNDFRKPRLVMGHGPKTSLVLRRQDAIETFTVTAVTKNAQ